MPMRLFAALSLTLSSLSCVDKSFVSSLGDTHARLDVAVSLGELSSQANITAVRIVAAYTAAGARVVLGELTVPYQQGESRDIALTLDIGDCLRSSGVGTGGSATCPVQVSVEVLADTRVLARDDLPIVPLRAGESVSTAALAARGAQSVRIRFENATPTRVLLLVGGSAALTAEPLDVGGVAIAGRTIAWSSSASTVASVSAAGLVTAIGIGDATITASIGTGASQVQSTTIVAVSAAPPATVALAPASASISVGATQPLAPTVRNAAGAVITPAPALTWSTSASTIATVSATGVVTGVAAGTATITARTENDIVGTATITVLAVPASVTLAPLTTSLGVGLTQTLTPTVRDGAGVVITPVPVLQWSTSEAAVATVSAAGVVTTVGVGTATISARTTNGITGIATITVIGATAVLQLTPSNVLLGISGTQALTVTARDAVGNTVTPPPVVTWLSSTPAVATVSATGVVSALAIGTTTITARTASNVTATANVTVGVSGSFSGRVYDFESNASLVGATVTISSGGSVVRTVTTNAQGNYNTGVLVGGPFDIRAAAAGFIGTDIRGLAVNGARVLEAVPLVRQTSGGGTITGTLLNATTNEPLIFPATLELYAGAGTLTGAPVSATSSMQGGAYQFTNIPAGTYTIVARASGFSNATRVTASLGAARPSSGQNLFLSPTSASGSLRIVLTWGAVPADLDSHLFGPGPNQSTFWVYWDSPGSCSGQPFACLDVDVVNGNGPETITIAARNPGRYVYSVHNFTATSGGGSGTLAQSNARVDVYSAAGLIQTFAVPAQQGTLWTVFDWDGTTIRPINTISDAPPPAADRASGALGADPASATTKKR